MCPKFYKRGPGGAGDDMQSERRTWRRHLLPHDFIAPRFVFAADVVVEGRAPGDGPEPVSACEHMPLLARPLYPAAAAAIERAAWPLEVGVWCCCDWSLGC